MATATSPKVTVPGYPTTDYRGFIFVVHEDHGLMLLYCTRKKKKGPHWQLPGGHIDTEEFLEAAQQTSDPLEQLQLAAKAGAARELYEETGMDLLRQLDRLQPSPLRKTTATSTTLPNLYKDRLFFFVAVTDSDFPAAGEITAIGTVGQNVRLNLSVEHSGFSFQPEPSRAAEMLQHHSGGKCTEALRMAQLGDNAVHQTQSQQGVLGGNSGMEVPPPPEREKYWCCLC